jgi:hypothetical protein
MAKSTPASCAVRASVSVGSMRNGEPLISKATPAVDARSDHPFEVEIDGIAGSYQPCCGVAQDMTSGICQGIK